MPREPLRIALLGCGTVGSAVARLIVERSDLYAERAGRQLELIGIAVRDATRPRDLPGVDPGLLSEDAEALVDEADLVVELMGGIEPARSLLERALKGHSHVVTANKQLIAHHGVELEELAAGQRRELQYEAAVMAAVPVLAVAREALAGDVVTSLRGVMNGSTNYVLDRVAREGMPFAEAVREAGELGYLEADPTEDLEGIDAAAKVVVLARTTWGLPVTMDDVRRTGITRLTDADFSAAADRGEVIKLVASAVREGDSVTVAVEPVALPASDPLARLQGGTNALVVEAESAGTLLLQGAGAGGDQTASAVLADVMRVARAG